MKSLLQSTILLLTATSLAAEPKLQPNAEQQSKLTPDGVLAELLAGNERYAKGKLSEHDVPARIKAGKTVSGFVYRHNESICAPTSFAPYELDVEGVPPEDLLQAYLPDGKLAEEQASGKPHSSFSDHEMSSKFLAFKAYR